MRHNSLDQQIRQRAARAIPGGMWGHMSARLLPESYPQFFARGEGCHLWDVDGNEYIDLMCSWGPMVLGHRHPVVQAAAMKQLAEGDCMNGPSPLVVDLAERMIELIPHADWAMFQKNGSDATTSCVTIARAGTGRRKILAARGSYHGAVPWCSPSLVGVTSEDRAHVIQFEYNDIPSLEAAVQQAGNDLAGIIVTAFRHDLGRDQQLPTQAFAEKLRAVCDRSDAALILDDVRAGCRIDLGGSWEPLGVRPDLAAWSKAIANGFPLASVTGNDRFREAAASIYVTGSFWYGATSMAAALATLSVLEEDGVIGHMVKMGERLRNGFEALSRSHGIGIRQTGPVQMPMVLFEDDPDFRKGFLFCDAALSRGAYLHPKHNMFLSGAHTEQDIDRVLDAADFAMQQLVKSLQNEEVFQEN
ncbi:glutamate-1-semialdehyde 2,1-aminomutase [Rhodoligotrophos appendicifer]|nr:aspartate aminotransferase family protein [Rhodoligotrophos appendicifer]